MMFNGWRSKLREAQAAFRNGQLDEASRLLRDTDLRDFLPAKRLLAQVAGKIAQRGETRMAGGQTSAGWHDLEDAARLGAEPVKLVQLREKMLSQLLAEVEEYIAAGDYRAALARVDELERRRATSPELRRKRQIAEKMALAQRLARRGRFAEAEQELAVAVQLSAGVPILESWLGDFRAKGKQLRELSSQLHQALAGEDWQRVLEHADAILEFAPDDRPARDARQRAWESVGMHIAQSVVPASRPFRLVTDSKSGPSDSVSRLEKSARGERFVLWVDEVGGFLVCLGETVTLGQPGPGAMPDVALLADLSRLQARICRDGEGYLLDPVRSARVANAAVQELTPLTDGNLLEFGNAVRIRFRKQHPLSSTARLEFVSHHRTQPSVDGVVLMAESCILGPSTANHIVCPEWTREVILFRRGEELFCRIAGKFMIDGVEQRDCGPISRTSTVSGDDFSFTLEAPA